MIVRATGPDDAGTLARLEQDTLGGDAWSAALVAEGVRGALATVRYLLAEVDGTAVGHAVVSLAGEVAELQRIGVVAGHRRGGVGTALLAAVVELGTGDGAERLLLEVRDDNGAARAFYTAHGFAEIARRARYYRDGAAAVVMERPLAPG